MKEPQADSEPGAIHGAREWDAAIARGPYSRRQAAAFIGMVVAVLAILNFAAGRVLPDVPDSLDAYRNEFRFRGYPEYLLGLSRADESRPLVLLSNSQAYSGELAARQGYPAQLERLLNERRAGDGTPWRVHNWSVDGTTSMEYMLMAARLKSLDPEVVVVSIGYADFRGQNANEGFSHCRSDLPRLVGRPGIARQLPAAFWIRHGRVEDTLSAVVRDRFALARLPEYVWSYLDQQYPGMMPLYYAPALYHHPWKLNLRRKWKRPDILRPPSGQEGAAYFAYDDRSTALLEEFLVALKEMDAPRLLVVACPGNERPGSMHIPFAEAFRKDIAALTRKHGIPFRDLSDALPREEFIDSLHFTEPNHVRYADRLWTELHPDPTP